MLSKLLSPCDMLWSRIWHKEELEFQSFKKKLKFALELFNSVISIKRSYLLEPKFGAGVEKGWDRDQAFTPHLGFTEQVNKFILIIAAKQSWL